MVHKTCPCGKKSKAHKQTYNVGETQKLTGFHWILSEERDAWLCPDCWVKLVEAYKRIYEISGNKYLVHAFIRREVVGE